MLILVSECYHMVLIVTQWEVRSPLRIRYAPPQEKPLILLESWVLFLYFFITVFRALTADLTATSFYPVF